MSRVYDAIVDEFKKDHKNVVSYDTVRQPKQDVLTESDLPELAIVPDTFNLDIGNASCGSSLEMALQVMVKTGDQRLNKAMFPVAWKLAKAYQRLRYGNILEQLLFNGNSFVDDVTFGAATLDLGAAERGVFGWACLWPINVVMTFTAEDLGS